MFKRLSFLICVLAVGFTAALTPAAFAVDETDPAATAPITMSPEDIQAMQDAAADQGDDRSVFAKASDFVSDNAPFFIIGIILIAAVLAGIFILRDRSGGPKAASPTRPGAAPAAVPSKAELRRRKRAAIQRSREEQRLRRRAGTESHKSGRRPAGQAIPGAAAATASFDPIEAEKQAARDQQRSVAAPARSGGAIPAPYSPSQNAPAPGVVTPTGEIVSPASHPWEQPATGAPPATAVPAAAPAPVAQPAAAGPAAPEPVPPAQSATPAAPAASPDPETGEFEPAVEAPGLDATVGNAAAAFAGAGVGAAAAGRAAAMAGSEPAAATDISEASAAEEAAPGNESEVDERLQAKLEEFRTGRPGRAFREFDPIREQVEPTDTDDDLSASTETDEGRGDRAEPELSPGLAAVERRLSADRVERDHTLRDAEERLVRIEQRAEDAERRAAFAERLAELKVEESDRERRLQDVVSGIDRAEKRAQEAEERARAAELAAAAALDHPVAPIVDVPEGISRTESRRDEGSVRTPEVLDPESGPERKELFGGSAGRTGRSDTTAQTDSGDDGLDLNRATFEELREADLSVTQATRVLAYRERFGGYEAIEDLEKVPGFPPDLVESLRSRFIV